MRTSSNCSRSVSASSVRVKGSAAGSSTRSCSAKSSVSAKSSAFSSRFRAEYFSSNRRTVSTSFCASGFRSALSTATSSSSLRANFWNALGSLPGVNSDFSPLASSSAGDTNESLSSFGTFGFFRVGMVRSSTASRNPFQSSAVRKADSRSTSAMYPRMHATVSSKEISAGWRSDCRRRMTFCQRRVQLSRSSCSEARRMRYAREGSS